MEFTTAVYDELKLLLSEEDYTLLAARASSDDRMNSAVRVVHDRLDSPIQVTEYASQTENACIALLQLLRELSENSDSPSLSE